MDEVRWERQNEEIHTVKCGQRRGIRSRQGGEGKKWKRLKWPNDRTVFLHSLRAIRYKYACGYANTMETKQKNKADSRIKTSHKIHTISYE